MDVEFKVEGLDKLNGTLGKIAEGFQQEKEKELVALGALVNAEIQLATPVDTGTLRRSIVNQLIDANNVEVGTDLDYAPFVNDGHCIRNSSKFVEGQHFMENGVQSAEPQAAQHIENWVEQMLSDFK